MPAKFQYLERETVDRFLRKEIYRSESTTALLRTVQDLGLIEEVDSEGGRVKVHWGLLRIVLDLDQQQMNKFMLFSGFLRSPIKYPIFHPKCFHREGFNEDPFWLNRFTFMEEFVYQGVLSCNAFIDIALNVHKLVKARNEKASDDVYYDTLSFYRKRGPRKTFVHERRENFMRVVTLFDCMAALRVHPLVIELLVEEFVKYFKDIGYIIRLFT